MPNFNQCLLIGHLTKDPEVRFTPSGKAVLNCGIAVNDNWKDANGEKQESVCFLDFTIWGTAGETFAQFTQKGSAVMLCGRLKMEMWMKDDEQRSKIIVIVDTFQFLSRKEENKK